MLIRAFKKESEVEVWKMRPDGQYVLVKTFPICRWSGQLGPKIQEGDRQTPEGFYSITPASMNPRSAYFLSFNVGYPNAYDRAHGATGAHVMVHGVCSSAGCFSMTDKQIAEIYGLARESFGGGQRAIQFQSYPFHLNAQNLAKHRLDPNMPFWKEIKKGNDYFEVTKRDVPVGVCNRHYVFGGKPVGGETFDAEGACPSLKTDPAVDAQVAQREAADEAAVAELSTKGLRPVRLVYQDGAQHPAFANRFAEVSRPDALVPPLELALDDPNAKFNKKARSASPAAALLLAHAQARAEARSPNSAQPEPAPAKHDAVADLGAAARAQGDRLASMISAFSATPAKLDSVAPIAATTEIPKAAPAPVKSAAKPAKTSLAKSALAKSAPVRVEPAKPAKQKVASVAPQNPTIPAPAIPAPAGGAYR
jgi:murein L,D-transpeptidase YafK